RPRLLRRSVHVRGVSNLIIRIEDGGKGEVADCGHRGSCRLQGRRARFDAFPLRYRTASSLNGGAKVLVAPPLTSAPGVLPPVAGFIHSTRIRPPSFERSTVKVPPEGA